MQLPIEQTQLKCFDRAGCPVQLSRELVLLTFAYPAMGERLGGVLVVALLALMTVASRGRVSTICAHAARDALR